MEDFTARLFERAGTTREDAMLMSELLVANDLRCVFSHGTQQIPDYLRKMVAGTVNPRPRLRDISESAGALVIDGDWGTSPVTGVHSGRLPKRAWGALRR
jgi:LDH2 family malate/lactate/ureidoglycolate dehydrogenase